MYHPVADDKRAPSKDHIIGTPLAFASSSYAPKTWVKFQDIPTLQVPNVKFVQGSITKVDPESKLATVTNGVTKAASDISYDYFVAASGLRRAYPVVPLSLSRKAFVLEAEEQIHAASNAPHGVVVVGGGTYLFSPLLILVPSLRTPFTYISQTVPS
jgi:NADH dehydrogenase FAD-containing subunit